MSSASPYVLRLDPAFLANPAPRLELREFIKSPERLTLFVRAFINVQDRPASRLDSYARIASIHGSPVPFDGFDPAPNDDQPFRGYCQHGSQHFGPWHRPYIMMLEQVLYAEVNRLAAEYTTGSYREAARAFRFPYWDTALRVAGNRDWLPDIMSQAQVQVTLPNGTSSTVRNPLASFSLRAADLPVLGVPPAFATVVRHPVPLRGSTLTGNAAVENALGGEVMNLRSEVTLLLKNPASYACASNHSATMSMRCSQEENVESVHDQLHGTVGGTGGHMSRVEYAAFDPAFWLHHCNVDRLLALWEGIYPTERIREGVTEVPGVGADRPDARDARPTRSTDPYYPFRKTATTWWTAQDVMRVYDPSGAGTRRLGYYYPEFQDPKVTPTQLLDMVDALYNDNPNTRRTFLNIPAIDTSRIPGSFNLRVGVQPNAAPAPGTRSLPMGKVHAGTVCLFKREERDRCDNCSKGSPLQRANIDITDALAKIQRDAPSSQNSLKLVLEVVPLCPLTGQAAPQAGLQVPVGDCTLFTVVNGVITSRGPVAPAATAGTRSLPQPVAPAPASDDTLPDIQLRDLKAVVQAVERPLAA